MAPHITLSLSEHATPPLNNKAGWWDHELMTRIRDAEALLGKKLTREQVIDIGNDLLKQFKLDQLPVHPYTKQ